jgi:hypothetical protein
LLWRTLRARKPAGARLEQLKDSGRALLFSRMPRMLRDDGRTPDALQQQFRYVENDAPVVPAITVSARRWRQALATSRGIARRHRTDSSPLKAPR